MVTSECSSTTRGSGKRLPVSIVLALATVRAGAVAAAEAVNKSGYQVEIISCGVHLTMRTGSATPKPLHCDYESLTPHTIEHFGNQPIPQSSRPGKYWAWFSYVREGKRAAYTAYAPLTVLGAGPLKNPPVFLVLTHANMRTNSVDVAEIVNRSNYELTLSGLALTPRASADFKFPQDTGINFDTPGNEVAPHSTRRFTTRLCCVYNSPGKYWVWTAYLLVGTDTTHVLYKMLAVTGP
jgi:hypothetical protein